MKEDQNISRKEAIKIMGKYGKYAAFASLGTFIILSPLKAQASSVAAGAGPVGTDDLGTGFD
jgi:hypothetical protein